MPLLLRSTKAFLQPLTPKPKRAACEEQLSYLSARPKLRPVPGPLISATLTTGSKHQCTVSQSVSSGGRRGTAQCDAVGRCTAGRRAGGGPPGVVRLTSSGPLGAVIVAALHLSDSLHSSTLAFSQWPAHDSLKSLSDRVSKSDKLITLYN